LPVAVDLDSTSDTLVIGGFTYRVRSGQTPREARAGLLERVFAALDDAGIRGFLIKSPNGPGPTIGVLAEHRSRAFAALGPALAGPGCYLQEVRPRRDNAVVQELSVQRLDALRASGAVRIAQYWTTPDGALRYDMAYATTLEFWVRGPDDTVIAPYPNMATIQVGAEFLSPATVRHEGRDWPSARLFDRVFLDEVDFPVDAVYTWVDGSDPAWRERFEHARAQLHEPGHHPESYAESRWASRDELRYSLRSLHMYAPWIRHIYLVTDQQVPDWLAPDARLTVVDHRDIFADPSVLPVFNSNAIIGQLHRIEGLSEHYLYINDDSFFGHDVRPEDFFYGNGIAKVFPSMVTRPFGTAEATDVATVSAAKVMRAMLEASTGRSLSRAIRHTPYPQLRSVNEEIAEEFPDVLAATARQKFRHHLDVPLDQFFHYYAQATGRAVPAMISYNYFNIGQRESGPRLQEFLQDRDRAVFTLNDSPQPGDDPVPEAEVAAFLEAYYPVRSSFEAAGPEDDPR
jgi:hypothetical protein